MSNDANFKGVFFFLENWGSPLIGKFRVSEDQTY